MPLAATVTPGKIFAPGEKWTTAKLNQLGQPTVDITGVFGVDDFTAADYSSVLTPGPYFYGLDTGAVNALAVTVPQAVPNYVDGLVLAVKVGLTNTNTAVTLNLNGLGAMPVKKLNALLPAVGDLNAGQIMEFRYRLDANIATGNYDNAGHHTIAVIAGWTYTWTPGAHDATLVNGINTYNTAQTFVAAGATVTLTGTANAAITATLVTPSNYWELMSPAPSSTPPPIATNLSVTATQAANLGSFTAARLAVINPANSQVSILTAVNVAGVDITLTVNNTTIPNNALDTGAQAASTWYYLHCIYNGATIAGLISLSPSAPTLPTGYFASRMICPIYSKADKTLQPFTCRNDWVYFPSLVVFAGAAAAAAHTYETLAGGNLLNFKLAVPPEAIEFRGYMASNSNAEGAKMAIAGDASGSGEVYNVNDPAGAAFPVVGWWSACPFTCPLLTPQNFWWQASTTTANRVIQCTGYRFER